LLAVAHEFCCGCVCTSTDAGTKDGDGCWEDCWCGCVCFGTSTDGGSTDGSKNGGCC
jgi:hypothetical protein